MRTLTFWLVVVLVTAVNGQGGNSTSSPWTERKYPKELYQSIQDRIRNNRRPDEAVAWGQWTPWTPCSRSCGGGVSSQSRQCLHGSPARRRRSVAPVDGRNRRRGRSDDNPNELNALEAAQTAASARSGCVGLYKRYHMCNTQACPEGSRDFRQQQCEWYNNKQFMGRYYSWETYWDASNPCELNCRALGFHFYALLNKTVIDGTTCRPNDSTYVCVAGSCKAIGCDGIVGSQKRLDGCGVCGGDNSTCQIVSGIFTEPHLPSGYNLVAQLPRGACHVNITELRPSRNYLALRRADGTFVFNGNWAINWSGEYQAAGTTFTYRRQDASTPELISTRGPLTEPIDIMVIYQQINPGIKYEYMLPLGAANPLIPPRPPSLGTSGSPFGSNRWQDSGGSAGQGRPTSLGAEGGLLQAIQDSNIQNSPPAQPGPSAPISSLSSSGSLANLGIAVPPIENNLPLPAAIPSALPVLPVPGSPGAASIPGQQQTAPSSAVNDERRPRNGHRGHGRRRQHNKQHQQQLQSLESQGKHLQSDLQGTEAGRSGGRGGERRAPRRHANGKGFAWKQIGFSECSKTCAGGLQQSLIVCVRESNQAPVADHRCKEADRPQSETVRCNTKPCPAEWMFGDWSPCSVTCGDGVQTRELACKQEISATLTMKVNEAACLTPAPSLSKVRTCSQTPCAKWHAAEWGKCSTDCGKGMRHRRVTCAGFDGRDVSEAECPASQRPATSDVCDMGSCTANTWFFTEWTQQCSEECGTGVQTRQVHCSGSGDDACDAIKKPEATRTCVSAKDCTGKWFAGPWSQCSATCDEGTQTREVVCLTFMRGQYRVGLDMQCPSRDKPEAKRTCHLGPCLPQWYMTEWSECSATCGTGAQRREVKCLDSNQTVSHLCREEDRPSGRQACSNSRVCNEEPNVLSAASEEDVTAREAQDTPVVGVGGDSDASRNGTEPAGVPAKVAKVGKSSKNRSKSAVTAPPPAAPAASATGAASAVSDAAGAGDSCVDKFKNCHLVVQARLCKLKYYLVSCCASCSKPKS